MVVDGDLASPALLVQLGAALRNLGYDDQAPVVIDLSESTGTSPAVTRLLGRFALVLSHRGVPFSLTRRPQPPATAGMMLTVAPSGVGVCRPPAKRTSSSPT